MSHLSSKPFVYPPSVIKYINAYNIFLSENSNYLSKNEHYNNEEISSVDESLNDIREELNTLKSGDIDVLDICKKYVNFVEKLLMRKQLQEPRSEKYKDSLRLLSTCNDQNGNIPLILAAENGCVGSLKFLIKWKQEEKIINHTNSSCKTAAHLVWKKLLDNMFTLKSSENSKYYECLLVLVQNESIFPVSKDFNKYFRNFEELESVIKDRENLHKFIKEKNIEGIKDYFSRNERLRFYFNRYNQSALYSALLAKNYEAYALLKSKGCNLYGYEEEKYLKKLDNEIKDKIKLEQNKYYDRPEAAHITYLILKSEGFVGKKENFEKVERLYKYLDSIEEISPLLKVIAYSDQVNNIIFEFYRNSLIEVEHASCDDLGICKPIEGRIYVAAGDEQCDVIGTLAHELTHFVMYVIFDNECKPFYEEDKKSEIQFSRICNSALSNMNEIDNIISRVFTCYTDRSQWDAELIVRVPHILATRSYKEGSNVQNFTADCSASRKILREQVPELQKFYNRIVSYVESNLYQIVGKIKLNVLNKKLEVIDQTKKYDIGFRNVINLEKFFISVDKKILLVSSSSALLSSVNIFQAIRNLSDDSQYYRSYIFCEEKHLGNIFTQEIMDNCKSNESCSLLIVKCDGGNTNWETLNTKLKTLIKIDNVKKIIFIASNQDSCLINSLISQYNCNVKCCGKEEDLNIEFTNLSDDNQKKFLETEITFQGEKIPLCKVIEVKNSGNAVNVNMMEKFVKGKDIEVGSRILNVSDLDNFAYHKVFTKIDVNLLKKSFHQYEEEGFVLGSLDSDNVKEEEKVSDLSIVSGIAKDELAGILEIPETKIQNFSESCMNETNDIDVILLQGIDYDENFKKFQKVCSVFKKRTVHFVEFQNNEFVWNCYYDPYYISRKFLRKVVDMHKIKKHIRERNTNDVANVFVFSGLSKKSELASLFSEDEIGVSTENDINEKYILLLEGENEENSFLYLCERLKDMNIHWIEAIKNDKIVFLWKRSIRDVSIIRELLMDKSNESFNTNSSENNLLVTICEYDLINLVRNENHVIIEDLAGMGKTTTLTVLSQEYNRNYPHEWILRIGLKDYECHVNKLPEEQSIGSVMNFFIPLSEDTIYMSLLKHSFFEKGNVFMLFDGFDEISHSQQKKIISLIQFLKESTKVKSVVTTRPYAEEVRNLENALSVIAIYFQLISVNECGQFLKNFGINALKFKCDVSSTQFHESLFFKILVREFNSAINDKDSNFMGVPLQARMFAEVYLTVENLLCYSYKKDTKGIESLFRNVNIHLLYDSFIKRKYEIYFNEKNRFGSLVTDFDKIRLEKSYQKDLQYLAFMYLFSDEEYFILLRQCFFSEKVFSTDVLFELNRIGITQTASNKIHFVHRTFAEYFLSEFCFDKFNKSRNEKYTKWYKLDILEYVLGYIFCLPFCNIIRKFINCKLDNTCYLLCPEEIFHDKGIFRINDISFTRYLQSFKDCGYMFLMPLYVIIEEGLMGILDFLLHSIQKSFSIDKLNFFIDYLKSESVLQLTVKKGYSKVIDNILKTVLVPAVKYEKRISFIYFLLADTMAFRKKEIIDVLLKYVKKEELMNYICCKTANETLKRKLLNAVKKGIEGNALN